MIILKESEFENPERPLLLEVLGKLNWSDFQFKDSQKRKSSQPTLN